MNDIIEKHYQYIYYNDENLANIIKNIPIDITSFVVVNNR